MLVVSAAVAIVAFTFAAYLAHRVYVDEDRPEGIGPWTIPVLLAVVGVAAAITFYSRHNSINQTVDLNVSQECQTSGNSALAGLDMVKCAGQRSTAP